MSKFITIVMKSFPTRQQWCDFYHHIQTDQSVQGMLLKHMLTIRFWVFTQ